MKREIGEDEVKTILSSYNVPPEVDNINLYRRAFVHHSFSEKSKSNERLEFLGDGILELVTKFYLYKRFPKENEGFLTEIKIRLVKNEALGKLAKAIGLHHWILEDNGNAFNIKILGSFFEAFLSAIFLDFNKRNLGFQMAQTFIESVFEKHVNWHDIIHKDDNYKNQLQIFMQKHFKTLPLYKQINYSSFSGYHMGVYICDGYGPEKCLLRPEDALPFNKYNFACGPNFVLIGEGVHKTKKRAEQLACQNALELILNAGHP